MIGALPLGLIVLSGCGALLVGGLLAVRAADQRERDAGRTVVRLRFPRGLTSQQVLSVVRVFVGIAPARVGFNGRDSVALELVGSGGRLEHRLRLPKAPSDYLIAQLSAAVPGLAIDEVKPFVAEQGRAAIELRRAISDADLATADIEGMSRTVLAAATGLRRHEAVVWQVVVGGGVFERPEPHQPMWQLLLFGRKHNKRRNQQRQDAGVVGVALRLGAVAKSDKRAGELLSRLRRAAAAASAPGARLVPRRLPRALVCARLLRAATPITTTPVPMRPEELAAVLGWPVGTPLVPGLSLGGSPQLPAAATVPRTGRVLGRATAQGRPVAQPMIGAREHTLIVGPTGSGKSWLAARLLLDDVAAGRGGLLIDPKGSTARAILERLPEEAIGRTVVVTPFDVERPVPLPLLANEPGGIPELAADNLIALLRHHYRDLGPRSSDILSSSLYALSRIPGATLLDLLPLWSDIGFRSRVAAQVTADPVLASFFGWFEALGNSERAAILAAPMNKIRPLLQRAAVRNVLAARRSTFTMRQVLAERLLVLVVLEEGFLGPEATTLLGQVVLSRLWSAVQARSGRSFFSVIVDEAPRFLDQPTDLGDVLARSREYGVGLTIIGQSLAQFPTGLREIALNSARTKVAFGTSSGDAKRLAEEFGPGVEADYFAGLARFEAIGTVSLGGSVSPAFTFVTEPLGPAIPGRAKAVQDASRARFGVARAEIEADLIRPSSSSSGAPGAIGRRAR